MVLTVSFVLSPVTGLFCHRRLQVTTGKLDASVGAPGPHDFSVRARVARLRRNRVHRIPHPTFVTMANAPLIEAGRREFVEMICPTGIAIYFCAKGWTGFRARRLICPSGTFSGE